MQIMCEGFWPQYSLEDITWLEWPNKMSKLAWPMVSFCDIPISRLRKHTGAYGNYGVGLCRERWSATGLNPVFYISQDSIVRAFLREVLLETANNQNPRTRTAGMITLGNCKPLVDKNSKDFYSECEWRFLPWVEGVGDKNKYGFFMLEKDFNDDQIRKEANAERRNDRMLEFYPDDVRYLLVNEKQEVPKLIEFIDTKMTGYSRLALDLLKTRIIVLAEISDDL
jgi:hypothetical protein